jgi:hypothetical protein
MTPVTSAGAAATTFDPSRLPPGHPAGDLTVDTDADWVTAFGDGGCTTLGCSGRACENFEVAA